MFARDLLHAYSNEISLVSDDPIVRIRLPETGKLRAREVVTRSRARSTSDYPSWKMGRMIQCESRCERDIYLLFDASPHVHRFYEQPLEITYMMNGKLCRHYPDTLVVLAQHKELLEIKPSRDALSAEHIERMHVLAPALKNYGYDYRVVLADEYVTGIALRNARLLLRHGRGDIPFDMREKMRRVLAVRNGCYWGDADSGLLGRNGRQYVCRLMLEGRLRWPVGQVLGEATWLTVNDDPDAILTE
jgi:hypothetical protein